MASYHIVACDFPMSLLYVYIDCLQSTLVLWPAEKLNILAYLQLVGHYYVVI